MTKDREERQAKILDAILQKGSARVAELCTRFDTSEATMRRDLDDLQSAGLVTRTHGGARAVKEQALQPQVLQRVQILKAEKQAIARSAASLVHDGDTIFLGSGSTVLNMVPYLEHLQEITVITNSLPVINRLTGFEHAKTVILGGVLRTSELSIIGHVAVKALEDLRAHKVFMGAEAVHPEQGLTNSYLEETMTDRAIITISQEIILLVDHTKFGRVHASFWAPLERVRRLITDAATDPAVVSALRAKGIEVTLAEPADVGPGAMESRLSRTDERGGSGT